MKKILLFAATTAIALSSCSENEVLDIANPNENPNAIGLNIGAFATKTAATDAATLQSGVTLYSTDGIFGNVEFTYASGEWKNVGEKKWDKAIQFPMSVFSAHDGASQAVTSGVASTDKATLSYEITATEGNATKDLVYFGQTLNDIPSAGKISAIYKHALSRVKMTAEFNLQMQLNS